MISEKIVDQSKRDAWEMGGSDTADLCAVDPDSAPSKAIFYSVAKATPPPPPTPAEYKKRKSVVKLITGVQAAEDVDPRRSFAETAERGAGWLGCGVGGVGGVGGGGHRLILNQRSPI